MRGSSNLLVLLTYSSHTSPKKSYFDVVPVDDSMFDMTTFYRSRE
jgi:hypothetical protein